MTNYIKAPQKNRAGEKVGGGWFVFRRGRRTGRIRPSNFPFEHPTQESAMLEARRLAYAHPGLRFCVIGQFADVSVEQVIPAEESAI
jgi:hypothetical protein